MRPVLVIRHVPYESLGLLGGVLQGHGVVYSYVDLFRETPTRFQPDVLAGLVILGGPMNVDEVETYPFLAEEVHWLHQALAAELPVLGICLGAQLLAKSLGARVYAGARKEIGWYALDLADEALQDEAFQGWNRRETVFQWHGDTFDLPSGAVCLASSPLFPHQAFRAGTSVYGLQFHLEVTPDMIDEWLEQPANCLEIDALDYIDKRAIRAASVTECPRLRMLAEGFFGRFAALCRARA